jgi:hypothetical protein
MSKKIETEMPPEEVVQAALQPVMILAKEYDVPAWELAALLRAEGWTEDKCITEEELTKAREELQKRAVGVN